MAEGDVRPVGAEGREEKPCPFCGQPILAVAVRCKHCKTDLDGRPRTAPTGGGSTSSLLIIILVVVVGGMVVIGVLSALLLPSLAAARKSAKKRDCTNNLRQLGTYQIMYVARYGNDRHYPPAPGVGFWDTLRTVPSRSQAIARGNDSLFVCKVRGTAPSSTALDYREPGPNFPGGRLSDDTTNPMWPISCDRTNNHSVDGTDDINVLFFSGAVSAESPGSPEWVTAINYTQ